VAIPNPIDLDGLRALASDPDAVPPESASWPRPWTVSVGRPHSPIDMSVIGVIDEIDLNLHPPLAQSLLSALPVLAPRSQFLLTTHSDAISGVVSKEQIYRLPGGRLCL
jgi:hypothetical protein